MADSNPRNTNSDLVVAALVTQFNALRSDMANRAALVHLDSNIGAVATPAASDLPTVIALVNACKATYNTHRQDAGAHVAADGTNVEATADATDLASSITLGNDLKAKFNAHVAQAGVHINNDAGTVTAANGTVLADTITLANDIKAKLNAHMARAASSAKVVPVAM